MKATFQQTVGLCILLSSTCLSTMAQGTAFIYQARLDTGGTPYTGLAEMQFSLWDAASGGGQLGSTILLTPVGVTNGLFIASLDFGNQFSGANRWLQIALRTNLLGFTTLSPRQPLTATPYAITAGNLTGNLPASQLSGTVPNTNLGGTYSSALTLNNAGNSLSGDGAGLTGLNAGQLANGIVPDARLAANVARTNQVWLLGGNTGTTAGTHFLGTADNQPVEFKVNGLRALRLEDNGDGGDTADNPDGAPNVIAGSPANFVAAGVVGATISGGGAQLTMDTWPYGPRPNAVLSDYATIGGGRSNRVDAGSSEAVIGGGLDNKIADGSSFSTIAGGSRNHVGADSYDSAIGGGAANHIHDNSDTASIPGGYFNQIGSTSRRSTIGGGYANTIGNNSRSGTIGGGESHVIGDYSTNSTIAGGYNHDIGTNAPGSSIGGGLDNTIQANAGGATIGGGIDNRVETNAYLSTIGGGDRNKIQTGAGDSTIGGGVGNAILAGAFASTIGGGADNRAGGQFGTVPGGSLNSATGHCAFAAGRLAKANHPGAFVWADVDNIEFASTASNQFLIRAKGGVGIGTTSPTAQWEVSSSGGDSSPQARINQANAADYARLRFTVGGDVSKRWDLASRSNAFVIYSGQTGTEALRLENNNAYVNGALVLTSDRNAKENIQPVDAGAVLEKVAALPIREWNYRTDAARSRHLGPMAQDFHAAFRLGTDDKHIATVDADGVALAAIQGLNQKVEDRSQRSEARMQKLEAENAELIRELADLKRLVDKLASSTGRP